VTPGSGKPLVPTAVQVVADVHDTPFRVVAGLRAGVVWSVQLVPFHNSGTIPTAVQAVAEVHETAESVPPPARVGVA